MSDDAKPFDREWRADFETAAQRTLAVSLAATPSERLAWLEEALAFAYRVGALKVRTLPERREESER